MKLRAARNTDVSRLAEIEKYCFEPPLYVPMARRQFRFHVNSPSAVVVVAEDDFGDVHGYALGFRHARRGTLRFYSLAVAPDVQRGEIGKILFRCIECEAYKLGLGVQCEVRDDNTKLQVRYTGLGYRPYRVVRNYYPDGAGCIKYVKSKAEISALFTG